jgi:hypothetical protein
VIDVQLVISISAAHDPGLTPVQSKSYT